MTTSIPTNVSTDASTRADEKASVTTHHKMPRFYENKVVFFPIPLSNELKSFLKNLGFDSKLLNDGRTRCALFRDKITIARAGEKGEDSDFSKDDVIIQIVPVKDLKAAAQASGNQALQKELAQFIDACKPIEKREALKKGDIQVEKGKDSFLVRQMGSYHPGQAGFWVTGIGIRDLKHPVDPYKSKETPYNRLVGGGASADSTNPTSQCGLDRQNNTYWFWGKDKPWTGEVEVTKVDPDLLNLQNPKRPSISMKTRYTKLLTWDFSTLVEDGFVAVNSPNSDRQKLLLKSEELLKAELHSAESELKAEGKEEGQDVLNGVLKAKVDELTAKLAGVQAELKLYKVADKRYKSLKMLWSKLEPNLSRLRKKISDLETDIEKLSGKTSSEMRSDIKAKKMAEKQAELDTAKANLETAEQKVRDLHGKKGFVLFLVTPGVISLYDVELGTSILVNEDGASDLKQLKHGGYYGRCMPGQLFEVTGKAVEGSKVKQFALEKMRLKLDTDAVLDALTSAIANDQAVAMDGYVSVQQFVAGEIQGLMKDYIEEDLPKLRPYIDGAVSNRYGLPKKLRQELKNIDLESVLGKLVKGILLAKNQIHENHPYELAAVAIKAQRQAMLAAMEAWADNTDVDGAEDIISGLSVDEFGKFQGQIDKAKAIQALAGMMWLVAHTSLREGGFSVGGEESTIRSAASIEGFNKKKLDASPTDVHLTIPRFARKTTYTQGGETLQSGPEIESTEDAIARLRGFFVTAMAKGKSGVSFQEANVIPEAFFSPELFAEEARDSLLDPALGYGTSSTAFLAGAGAIAASFLLGGKYETLGYVTGGVAMAGGVGGFTWQAMGDVSGPYSAIGDGIPDGVELLLAAGAIAVTVFVIEDNVGKGPSRVITSPNTDVRDTVIRF